MQEIQRDPSDDLRQQIAELNERVWWLEQALRKYGVEVPHGSVPAAATPPRTAPRDAVPAGTPHGELLQRRPGAPPHQGINAVLTDERGLESQIGSHVFNRVGIIAVLIGMAWFLKFAFDNQWVGPVGRTVIGLLAGAGLVVWSERFRHRGYPAFSYSLKAVGSGILYLSLWVAYDVYHLMPAGVAFLAMMAVTAWNGFMCWAQDSEILALYALVGGVLTPVLASTGENHQLVLFSYVLLLDVTVLVVTVLRPWPRLVLGAFVATAWLLNGWGERFYTDQAFAITVAFVAVFVLLFAVAPLVLRRSRGDAPGTPDVGWARIVLVLLPLANAGLGFGTVYAMLTEPGRQWARPWAAVVFAAVYLLLLRRTVPDSDADRSKILTALHLTLVVTFAAIAIPLQARSYWVAVGWLVEGAALMWGERRFATLLLRVLAIGLLLLGLAALFSIPPVGGPVVLNTRFATYVVAIVVFTVIVRLAYSAARTPERPAASLPEFAYAPEFVQAVSWRHIAVVAVVAVNALTLAAVGAEIHAYWASAESGWVRAEQFSHSIWWMLYGALLLAVGFWKRSAFLRWQALFLLALSIGKVFLVDMSELSEGYRILSFLGLGALLLAISFVYQRDWLGLRTPSSTQSSSAESVE